jgi:hypothetical protein
MADGRKFEMTCYRIENLTSGHVFGEYEGETTEAAWAALCEEAGSDEAPGSDIRFTEVKDAGDVDAEGLGI